MGKLMELLSDPRRLVKLSELRRPGFGLGMCGPRTPGPGPLCHVCAMGTQMLPGLDGTTWQVWKRLRSRVSADVLSLFFCFL